MDRFGLDFACLAAAIDEESWKRRRWPAPETAKRLSIEKAMAVFARRPDAVVVGADQVASLDSEIFDKPGDVKNAKVQLRRLSGRTFELSTGVAVAHSAGVEVHVESVLMTMRDLQDDEIDRYIDLDSPLECAGCFRWESRGPALFSTISTKDPTAILGLPMLWLSAALRSLGYRLP